MVDALDEPTERVLLVPLEDIGYLREVTGLHGVELAESKPAGVEPTATIAVALLGGVWAVNTVCRLLDDRKGGQVIDVRPGVRRSVYRSRDVQAGLIVILAADGTVTLHCRDSQDRLGMVIESLAGLSSGSLPATTEVVEGAVRGALGSDAQVVASPQRQS